MAETKPFQAGLTGVRWPPGEDDLPCDDGMPMETERHVLQMLLLTESLRLFWADRQDVYVGGNMFLYYSLEQVRNQDFIGPDVFAVVGVRKRERKSWVAWEEGKAPDVVIELLSESTATYDKTEKKQLYQDRVRVPEYFWFDPFSDEWAGFRLRGGQYEPIAPDIQDRLVSEQLGLALVREEGTYQGVSVRWLRWTTLDGTVLPTSEEKAAQERQRAEEERQRAEEQQQRAAELEALLTRYRDRFGELSQ